MIPNPCIEVHTSPVDRPSVPPWFAEVVIIAHHLRTKGLLDAFAHQVRLVRGRFGSYEPIDFLALLVGYAISGERTVADFFERLAPFGSAFMALFGRKCLPHRSSLSRFLADVDRPCLEALRMLFQQHSFADGWTTETIGGIFDRKARRFIVFDVDATRQPARQRALPSSAELPPPRRRLDAVCAPGYTGRKRGEVVRTRTTALQMHTRQWVGTYAGKGNGDYREELASALQAITTYLKQFAFSSEMALVRLDGQYGDASVVAQILLANVHVVTRGKGYQLLEHPQIQSVLAHPPTARVSRMNTDEIVELFDGGWLPTSVRSCLTFGSLWLDILPLLPAKTLQWASGSMSGSMNSFSPILRLMGFSPKTSWTSIMDVEHSRWCWQTKMWKKIPTAGALLPSADKNSGKSYVNGCGICASRLDTRCRQARYATPSWAPPKEAPAVLVPVENPAEEYGPWQRAAAFGRATGRFGADAFVLQENGTLRCPAGASLWLSEVRQENAFTQRAVYVASQTDCPHCALREQCLASGAKGHRARRKSRVRRLLPPPASVERKPVLLGSIRWVDVAGRSLRRGWIAHWRRQHVEVFALADIPKSVSPPSRPPRAVRSHHRWSWQDRLARNAWWGPPQVRVTVAGVPAFLALS
jgi:hypothetical protein